MIELIGGIIIGILLGIVVIIAGRNIDPRDSDRFQERIMRMLPHKKGEIVGLSEEEENFKNSLKEKEDTKIT